MFFWFLYLDHVFYLFCDHNICPSWHLTKRSWCCLRGLPWWLTIKIWILTQKLWHSCFHLSFLFTCTHIYWYLRNVQHLLIVHWTSNYKCVLFNRLHINITCRFGRRNVAGCFEICHFIFECNFLPFNTDTHRVDHSNMYQLTNSIFW